MVVWCKILLRESSVWSSIVCDIFWLFRGSECCNVVLWSIGLLIQLWFYGVTKLSWYDSIERVCSLILDDSVAVVQCKILLRESPVWSSIVCDIFWLYRGSECCNVVLWSVGLLIQLWFYGVTKLLWYGFYRESLQFDPSWFSCGCMVLDPIESLQFDTP